MPAYAALYRAWRPRRLSDVVGQEHVTRTLRNALRQSRAAHAYLFCGPHGTGKTSTARILAAGLNCLRPADGDACGECQRCAEVAADRLVDVLEVDAASHRQVEDVRALRETVGYAPVAGRHKVYILDEVHMLTDASWNTLLKTLEEPPASTTFVLCTTDPRKVLPTVVSRCQRFDFRRLTVEEIGARLKLVCDAERIRAAPAALEAVARRAEGGLRDALSILEQATAFAADGEITPADVARVVGAADDEAVARLLSAAEAADASAIFTEVDRLYGEGKDMAQVTRDLLAALRERMVALGRAEGAAMAADGGARLRWHLRAIGALGEAEGQMRRAAQSRLPLEVGLLTAAFGAETALAQSAPGHQPGGASAQATPQRQAEGAPARSVSGRPPAQALAQSTAQSQVETASSQSAPRGRPEQGAEGPGTRRPAGGGAEAESHPGAARPAPAWSSVLQILSARDARAGGLLRTAEVRPGGGPGVLRLRFPTPTQAQVAERAKPLIVQAWGEAGGGHVRVEYVAGDLGAGPGQSAVGDPSSAHGGQSHARRDAPSAGRTRPVRQRGAAAPDAETAFRNALALFDGTPL